MIELICRDGSASYKQLKHIAAKINSQSDIKVSAYNPRDTHCVIFWSVGDVKSAQLQSGLTSYDEEAADKFFDKYENGIKSAMMDAGWDAIYDCIRDEQS